MTQVEEYDVYVKSDAYRREVALRQAEATVSRSRGYGSTYQREPDVEADVTLRIAKKYENYLNKGDVK